MTRPERAFRLASPGGHRCLTTRVPLFLEMTIKSDRITWLSSHGAVCWWSYSTPAQWQDSEVFLILLGYCRWFTPSPDITRLTLCMVY